MRNFALLFATFALAFTFLGGVTAQAGDEDEKDKTEEKAPDAEDGTSEEKKDGGDKEDTEEKTEDTEEKAEE